ncbi:MAG: hypothetical protein U1A77_14915 [Pirellulales bacterium]
MEPPEPVPPKIVAAADVYSEAAVPAEVIDDGAVWSLLTPEGLNYGPVTRDTLERWVREGRVTGDCRVRCVGDETWRSAEMEFPVLTPPSSPPAGVASVSASGVVTPAAVNSGASHRGANGLAVGDQTPLPAAAMSPHRGPLILTLAIVGVFVQCPIFSVMAWVMGSSDLEEMARGRMDPAGASVTRTGRNLGLILSLFWIIMAVILVAGLLFVAASRA